MASLGPSRHQSGSSLRELEKQMAAMARDRAAVGHERSPDSELRALASRFRRRVRSGHPVGRIALPTLDRRYVMVEGTDTATLRKGPAHYPETALPGQGGTVAVAGHRTTYLAPFRPIDRLRPGQPIVLTMPYGRFTYRLERTRIVRPDAVWVTRRVGYERLVLSACHPLYSAARRIVVFARLVRTRAIAPGTQHARG